MEQAAKELPKTKEAPEKPNPKPPPIKPGTEKPAPKPPPIKPGTVLWEFETGHYVSSSPAIGSDGTVYVGSWDNKLYAIKTDSNGPAKSPWPMRGQNAQHTGRVMKK